MLQRIRDRLSNPQISRGFHLGLAGWLYVVLMLLIYLLFDVVKFLIQVVGRIWVPQDENAWLFPLAVLTSPITGLAIFILPTLAVIGGILSLVDIFRRKRWALLGLVMSAALPLVVLFMIFLMVGGSIQGSR